MPGRLLTRGMIAGIIGALLAFIFAKIFGEPQINLAIAFEKAQDIAAGTTPEPEIVSRSIQASFGLLIAAIMYGTAYGGIFALIFSFAYGRIGQFSARTLSLVIAMMSFIIFVLLPDLKYPPNPPAVGLSTTINYRTETYFGIIILSLCSFAAALMCSIPLIKRFGKWNGTIITTLIFISLTWLVQNQMPDINEVPAHFPAVVLWRFREAAIGMQLVLWSTIGLVFGALASHVLEKNNATT
ncbi:CbtA family protein [Swingsia samuiensis]|uniref:CbtA family protein n=1 Tax=Swingsia samuiensis TaxID=1293412 RepID=A0A4Y6UJG8_9PROT|nr:CbtA family protein [Swingsia samuiensis]QDH17743.1 hypothetical protein E3D00_09325 [Swingsia samuiensis]